MKLATPLIAVGIVTSLALSLANWFHESPSASTTESSTAHFQTSLSQLQGQLTALQQEVAQQGPAGSETGDHESRLSAIETSLAELQRQLQSLNLEESSAKRDERFRSEFGYEKADEYAALGNHAVAGNGYLLFLEAHPDHPDARDIMQKARESYLKAGYKDKATWLQGQLMERYPDRLADDAYKMALMLKQEKRYDEALDYIDQASGAASNDVERLWRESYRAFLIQQRDGNAAGIDAFRKLAQQIDAANLAEDQLGEHAKERIADLEKRLAQQGG